MKSVTRRVFLKQSGAVAVAALGLPAIIPARALGRDGHLPPSERLKLNVALVGLGLGRGQFCAAPASARENVVAICDVNEKGTDERLAELKVKQQVDLSTARRFTDFRKMLDIMGNEIDAVVITTPDHTHFPIAMAALQCGKHVMVEKPLTHTVWEARELRKAAGNSKLITQMGNQGHAGEGIRLMKEWYEAGLLGEVREVLATSPRQGFRFPVSLPPPAQQVPEGFNWDVWLGPARERPYASCYQPKAWRGWWDFGSVGMGDFGCHTLDAPWWVLDLGTPSVVSCEIKEPNLVHAPGCDAIITFQVPARGDRPPVKVTWHEGENPPLPHEYVEQFGQAKLEGGRAMFMIGSKATLMADAWCQSPRIIPEGKFAELKESLPPKTIPRVKGGEYKEFFDAVKGLGPEPGSRFAVSGPLTEFVQLGALAMRTGKTIEWNSEKLSVTNEPELNQYIKVEPRKGWEYTA